MTMHVATLEPWQHSSPTGGFVNSTHLPSREVTPGSVIRNPRFGPPWVAVAVMEHRLGMGLVATLTNGERWWLLNRYVEVRTDVRWEPAVIAACGCWDTSYLDHGGIWTCDSHRRRAA